MRLNETEVNTTLSPSYGMEQISEPFLKDFLHRKMELEKGVKVYNFNYSLDTSALYFRFLCSGDDGERNGMIYMKLFTYKKTELISDLRDYKLNLII